MKSLVSEQYRIALRGKGGQKRGVMAQRAEPRAYRSISGRLARGLSADVGVAVAVAVGVSDSVGVGVSVGIVVGVPVGVPVGVDVGVTQPSGTEVLN